MTTTPQMPTPHGELPPLEAAWPDETLIRATGPTCVVPYIYVRAGIVRRAPEAPSTRVEYAVQFWFHDTREELGRPHTHSISTGHNERLAHRLATAVEAGVVFTRGAIVLRDINDKSYVESMPCVMGRYLNADLNRLGF